MGSKVSKIEWVLLYVVMGAIDLIQIIIDFFPPVGETINVVADALIGPVLLAYFQIRGVNILGRLDRIASLLGVTGLGVITGGLAPAWIIDIWYIHLSDRREKRVLQASKDQELLDQSVNQPLNRDGVRQPYSQSSSNRPANIGGTRAPGQIVNGDFRRQEDDEAREAA